MNSKTYNRKELFLDIYDNIKNKTKKYYVPLINTGTNPTLQDVFEGTERLYFLENALYFISESVVDAYKVILPKNIIYKEVSESDFNILLEDICSKQLPNTPIALVEDEEKYVVEKSNVLVGWINEEVEDKIKYAQHVKYIDSEKEIMQTTQHATHKKTFKEHFILGSTLAFLFLLKILFLYVSIIFTFNILQLTGVISYLVIAIVFIVLNTLSDITVRGILDAITTPKNKK